MTHGNITIESLAVPGLKFIIDETGKLIETNWPEHYGISEDVIEREKALLFDSKGRLDFAKAVTAYKAQKQAYSDSCDREEGIEVEYPEWPEELTSRHVSTGETTRMTEPQINRFADSVVHLWGNEKAEKYRRFKLGLLNKHRQAMEDARQRSGIADIALELGRIDGIHNALAVAIARCPVRSIGDVQIKLKMVSSEIWYEMIALEDVDFCELIAGSIHRQQGK